MFCTSRLYLISTFIIGVIVGYILSKSPWEFLGESLQMLVQEKNILDMTLEEDEQQIQLFNDKAFHNDNSNIANVLAKKIRILCLIPTAPKNIKTRVVHVEATWGRRCTKTLYFNSAPVKGLNTVVLPGIKDKGSNSLTGKMHEIYKYAYDNYYDKMDWFYKADDDTYTIVENLRYMLSEKDTTKPIYFGQHFHVNNVNYTSGGAGYIISKEALRRFATVGYKKALCRARSGMEDLEMGRCFKNIGVKLGDSRDALGRTRFHCFDPSTHLVGRFPGWYIKYDQYGSKKGIGAISDYAITFHYIRTNYFYEMEYFLYHLRPYGLYSLPQSLNKN